MGRSFDLTRRRFMTLSASLPLAACAGTPQMSQPPSGQFITVSGKRLHYTMAGEGPPVILLHGASGNFLDWTFGRFDELAKTHKVLAFDRPGLGFSDAADDPSLSSQVALMVEAARQLGMERATVVGHSFGGAVALAWALDAPETVNSLMLLSAPSMIWPGSAGRLYDLANTPVLGFAFSRIVPLLASERRIQQAVDTIFEPQPMPDGYIEFVRSNLSANPTRYRTNAIQVAQLKPQIEAMVPRYGELSMPIELIHGTLDTIVPADIHSIPFSKVVPEARLTLLDGIGHMPHHIKPDVFFEVIRRLT